MARSNTQVSGIGSFVDPTRSLINVFDSIDERNRQAILDQRYQDELAYRKGRDTRADELAAESLAYSKSRDTRADELAAESLAYSKSRDTRADELALEKSKEEQRRWNLKNAREEELYNRQLAQLNRNDEDRSYELNQRDLLRKFTSDFGSPAQLSAKSIVSIPNLTDQITRDVSDDYVNRSYEYLMNPANFAQGSQAYELAKQTADDFGVSQTQANIPEFTDKDKQNIISRMAKLVPDYNERINTLYPNNQMESLTSLLAQKPITANEAQFLLGQEASRRGLDPSSTLSDVISTKTALFSDLETKAKLEKEALKEEQKFNNEVAKAHRDLLKAQNSSSKAKGSGINSLTGIISKLNDPLDEGLLGFFNDKGEAAAAVKGVAELRNDKAFKDYSDKELAYAANLALNMANENGDFSSRKFNDSLLKTLSSGMATRATKGRNRFYADLDKVIPKRAALNYTDPNREWVDAYSALFRNSGAVAPEAPVGGWSNPIQVERAEEPLVDLQSEYNQVRNANSAVLKSVLESSKQKNTIDNLPSDERQEILSRLTEKFNNTGSLSIKEFKALQDIKQSLAEDVMYNKGAGQARKLRDMYFNKAQRMSKESLEDLEAIENPFRFRTGKELGVIK
jgi:hypothetical protein